MTADGEAAMANPTPAADQPAWRRRPSSAETLRLYAVDWAAFEDWCRGRALATLPADPATVAAFLTAGADTLGAGALGRRAAAIAAKHRQVGLASPAADPAVTAILHAACAIAPCSCSDGDHAGPIIVRRGASLAVCPVQALRDWLDSSDTKSALRGRLRTAH